MNSGLPPADSIARLRASGDSWPRGSSDSASRSASSGRERREPDGLPVGALVEQLGATEAEDEDRPDGLGGDALDEVEERRLGPVQVLQLDDERPLAGDRLEQAPRRPGDVVGGRRAVGEADRLGERERSLVAVLGAGEQRDDALPRPLDRDRLLEPGGPLEDVAQRPVRRALPVGEAAAADDRRPAAESPRRARAASRDLPTPGSPTTATSRQRPWWRRPGRTPRAAAASSIVAPDHRRAAAGRPRAASSSTETSRTARNGSDLPFAPIGATGSASTASRTSRYVDLADQRLALAGVLLEPCGDVDGVADHDALPRRSSRR